MRLNVKAKQGRNQSVKCIYKGLLIIEPVEGLVEEVWERQAGERCTGDILTAKHGTWLEVGKKQALIRLVLELWYKYQSVLRKV